MKTLSVRQPHAALICAGVKTVENRTWKTDYRGRLFIHASGNAMSFYDFDVMPQKWNNLFADYIEKHDNFESPEGAPESIQAAFRLNRRIFEHYHQPLDNNSDMKAWIKDAVKQYGCFFTSQAIIGEATLTDIVQNSKDDFAEPRHYHWIMSGAVLYDKPIINVMGRLRLWEFNKQA
jgi:hypothetical protein